MAATRFDVLTLFPELFEGFVGQSIVRRALDRELIEIHRHDIRDWATGKHAQVDDRPFGGGPGMLLMAPPVVGAVEAVQAMAAPRGRLLLFSPRGRRLDQRFVAELANEPRLVLLCGRYEGFDERVIDILEPEVVSIGDYVLSGGEVPAMVVIEAVSRLIPGVLGDSESASEDSFSFADEDGDALEYPHYTRPREFRGLTVPEVLISGDHQAVARWRSAHRKPVTVADPAISSPEHSITSHT